MPRKKSPPKFFGPLAERIYEPPGRGLLGIPNEEERQQRIFERRVDKLPLLFDHYGIDKDKEHRWIILSLRLAADFVPGMMESDAPPPKPGRKRTWQAGLGDELLRAVQDRLAARPSRIDDAIEYVRKTDDAKWGRYPPQTLAARMREAKQAHKRRREHLIRVLSKDSEMSLARLALEYDARMRMGGLFGLGQGTSLATSNPPDENKNE